MSWFFVRTGPVAQLPPPRLPNIRYEIRNEDLYIAAGGPESTCLFHTNTDGSGFVLCGAGLRDDGKHVHIMDSEDWQAYLYSSEADVSSIGGHFACVSWTRQALRFFNDALGIREIFFASRGEGLTVSTHLDLVTATTNGNTLNTSAFGGKWCLYIQGDHGSPIKEFDRLGPHGMGTFDTDQMLRVSRRPPVVYDLTSKDRSVHASIADKIKRFTIFPIGTGNRTKLSLSGGVDSRLILAALNDQTRESWDAFTFGEDTDADVRVARLLSRKLNFPLQIVHPPAITHEAASNFVIQTDLFKPISASYAHLSFHELDDGIIIDGAPGELLRRRLFTKLEHFGAKALTDRNWSAVAKYLWSEQPSIFNDELLTCLRKSALDQVHTLGESMPSSKEIGVGNWIDTMFCRTWYANTSGADQRRIDGIMLSTSPFAQPSMLNDIFQASERYRRSGKLAKNVLYHLDRKVARYPYAKDEVIFPSWTPWYLAKLYGKLVKKTSPVIGDQVRFLEQFKQVILDRLNSLTVQKCDLYDRKRVLETVNAYYRGEHQHAAFVDWWYSFEVWRSANRITSWG